MKLIDQDRLEEKNVRHALGLGAVEYLEWERGDEEDENYIKPAARRPSKVIRDLDDDEREGGEHENGGIKRGLVGMARSPSPSSVRRRVADMEKRLEVFFERLDERCA